MNWIDVNDRLPEDGEKFWGLEIHKGEQVPIGYRIHGLECWASEQGLYGFNNDGMGEGSQVWLFEIDRDWDRWVFEDQIIRYWLPLNALPGVPIE